MSGWESSEDSELTGVGTLEPWEALAVDAVGNVIDFWKFKRNQGRMWALLYLRGKALSASEIQEALGLSKGGVSMLVRELEGWGIVRRVRAPRDDNWRYEAGTDLARMVGRVISERESQLVESVRRDLQRADTLAEDDGADPETLERLRRMLALAVLVDRALKAFLATMKLDVAKAFDVLGRFEKPTKEARKR